MNKILKRLLTGVLTLATVFTALPTTAVHAAETQYWTESEERVGIVEKVMNDGSIGSTFNEGHMTVEGEDAYCIDINTGFTSTPDDSKGALLYDTYTIEELRCDSNKGMTLIPAFDVVVSRNKVVVDLGTLTDEYEPEITIHTTATDKVTGEKSIVAGKNVTIVDTVTLDGLTKGTKYQLKGWQMVKSENAQLLIDGQPVESNYTFTAKKSEMEVEVSYTFNASALGGKDLVTFEELYDLSNPDEPIKVAEHKDIEDEGQTVTIEERVIEIHTNAVDKATVICHFGKSTPTAAWCWNWRVRLSAMK